MKTLKSVLFIIALVSAFPSIAGETNCSWKEFCDDSPWPKQNGWTLQVNGRSFHRDEGYNENNRGLGLEYELEYETHIHKFTAGTFINSMEDRSWYAGIVLQKRFHLDHVKVDTGAYFGFLTYPSFRDSNGPLPALLPALSISGNNVGVNLLYFPGYKEEIPAAAFVQLTIKL